VSIYELQARVYRDTVMKMSILLTLTSLSLLLCCVGVDAGKLGVLALFILPSYIANMSPPLIIRKLGLIGRTRPISVGLFGENKTVEGFLVGVAAGLVTGGLLAAILYTAGILTGYQAVLGALLGGLAGALALAGDLVESYFKRRSGRRPGEPWVPHDQIDFYLPQAVTFWIGYYLLGIGRGVITPWELATAFLVGVPLTIGLHVMLNCASKGREEWCL